MGEPKVPVTVVTGFLGAGKSTLLEGWLEQLPRETTALIINEEGSVGIDGTLLAERAGRMREITGGCVCCVTQAALDAALAELAGSTPTPTRIVVETSGAASPAGVIRPVLKGSARDELRLDGVVTVVDASRARKILAYPLAVEQLGFADIVVMSHADHCSEAELASLEPELLAYAPAALLARAAKGQVAAPNAPDLEGLLAARGDRPPTLPSEPGRVERHGMDAVSLAWEGEVDETRFIDWVERTLGAIESRILRVKGIVAVQGIDERVIVQGVGEAVEVTLGAAWGDAPRNARFVVIGLSLDEAALHASFAGVVAGPGTG